MFFALGVLFCSASSLLWLRENLYVLCVENGVRCFGGWFSWFDVVGECFHVNFKVIYGSSGFKGMIVTPLFSVFFFHLVRFLQPLILLLILPSYSFGFHSFSLHSFPSSFSPYP